MQERVADRFVPLVLDRAKQIKFGDPMDPETDLGTVVHEEAARLFERRVHEAAEQGAKVLYDPGRKGAVLPPITVDFVPHDSELVFEETFGPDHPDRPGAERRCGGDPHLELHALRAFLGRVHQRSRPRSPASSRASRSAPVNIWEVPGYRIEMSPFGGIKDSGNGVKEGVMEAMKFFTNVKTYSLPWPA